ATGPALTAAEPGAAAGAGDALQPHPGEPVRPALDLRPVLRFDGVQYDVAGVRRIGDHGLAAVDFDAGVLRLAPFDRAPSEVQAAVLAAPEELAVPAEESAEFVGTHLPALLRHVPIFSADGSFTPPPPPPATLVLRVDRLSGDRLALEWRWRRADGQELRLGAPEDEFDEPLAHRSALLDRVHAALAGWEPESPWPATSLTALPVPETAVLGDADAASFAVEVLPALEALAGVEVAVSDPLPPYREEVAVPELAVTRVDDPRTDWLDLGVLVTVGGRRVAFQALFIALAKGAKRLKLVDNSYLKLDRPELDPLKALLEEAGLLREWEPETNLPPAERARLTSDFEDLAEFAEPAVAWRQLVRSLEDAEVAPIAPPADLRADLRPYQLDGFRRLAFLAERGLGGILADDMGLGKTVQTLALLLHLRELDRSAEGQDAAPRPFLVVAPTSVATNWVREAERFAPGLRVALVSSTRGARADSLAAAAASADLVVTTYSVLRLAAPAFHALRWRALVIDEAQAVKNPATKSHAAVAGVRAPVRLALTGTPVENHLGDLWSILAIVAPGLFPSRRWFTEHWRRPIERGNVARLAELRDRVRPLLLRRTKELVAPELPPKQEQTLELELAPAHRRLYDATLQRERQKLLDLLDEDESRQRFILYRSITLLRMLALDAALIDAAHEQVPSAKLDALLEQLDDVIQEGHRALVFSQFTTFLDRIQARLERAGAAFARLDGSTSMKRRDAEIARFRAGEAGVFLISLKAGGVGLNLTEADYVFLADPWWNPAVEEQAIDRTHRIGQERQVMVYRLVAAGTIEQKVLALAARKGELAESLLDAPGGAGAGLTSGELRALLD
ncbi:DEAD/DEAH box helicase, partial [Agromyces seonyuensis]